MSMRDWDDHRLILTLHRCGTLRAAGDALNVTHTTVARRLAALESREPTPVFKRLGRAYRVTEYGAERVTLAEKIEALDYAVNRVQRRSGDALSGPLSLSVPQAVYQYLLVDAIGDFAKHHPDIELTVIGSDRLADLDRGEADVVIRGQASPPDHLVGRQICTVGLSHYAHKDYFDTTSVEERSWVGSRQAQSWLVDSPYPDYPIGLIIDDIPSRFVALTRGQGLSRAACFMADPDPNLVRVDTAPAIPLYGLWVLTHPDLRSSPKVIALMRALSEALVAQKALIAG